MKQWKSIEEHIAQVTGQAFSVGQQRSLGGGSINAAYLLIDESSGNDNSGRRFFVKTNRTGRQDMFEAECKGLEAMASSETIRVPNPVCFGDDGNNSYIVMEYLEMQGRADQAQLGQRLAEMHRLTQPRFGWDIDNTIGSTHQPNPWADDWLEFWRDHRLGYQLELAAKNGYGGELQSLGNKVLADFPQLFAGHEVKPSMLHGDLWGGNVAGLSDGTPVIFDPAFYYGDREADLAMTYVFGGFGPDFYASYQNAWPLDDGFAVRKTLYNAYHIINHLNIFGGGYHGQAIHMLEQVLAETR